MSKARHLLLALLCALPAPFAAAPAAAEEHALRPGQRLVGAVRVALTRRGDTMPALAREFDLGYEELVAANPAIDPWEPGEGRRVVLPGLHILPPGPRAGVYVDRAGYRLFYYPPAGKGRKVLTFPISIGRGDWPTPTGPAKIIDKIVSPTWYPPASVLREAALEGEPLDRVVPPGPDNPLGKFALQLNLPGYFIHGTNKPYAIGMKVTHGCIRLAPKDIARLFQSIPRNTPVFIDDAKHRLATHDGVVYLEARGGDMSRADARRLTAAIRRLLVANDGPPPAIDWRRVAEVARAGRGIPTPITWGDAQQTRPAPRRAPAAASSPTAPGARQIF